MKLPGRGVTNLDCPSPHATRELCLSWLALDVYPDMPSSRSWPLCCLPAQGRAPVRFQNRGQAVPPASRTPHHSVLSTCSSNLRPCAWPAWSRVHRRVTVAEHWNSLTQGQLVALLCASGRTRISEIAKFSLETQVYQLASPVLFDFGFPKQHLKHLSRGLKLFVYDTCFKGFRLYYGI